MFFFHETVGTHITRNGVYVCFISKTCSVSVLEKRLQEKITENDELQAQIQRARDTTQSAINTRDEIQKKVAGTAKLAQVYTIKLQQEIHI